MLVKGRVLQAVRNNFLISYKNHFYSCFASGKIIYQKTKIVCGDYVKFNPINKQITLVLPRQNLLPRPQVANVNKVFITCSFQKPKLSLLLLDKMILFYSLYNLEIIIVLTKKDLCQVSNFQLVINDYRQAGYKVIVSSCFSFNQQLFYQEIKNSTSIFAGPSGVGKSTILNFLMPNLNIKTNLVSAKLQKGVHTTTKSTLYHIAQGYVCDTPGFFSLKFKTFPKKLAKLFKDFRKLALKCSFNDCLHFQEKKCGVKQAVKNGELSSIRYNNYLSIIQES